MKNLIQCHQIRSSIIGTPMVKYQAFPFIDINFIRQKKQPRFNRRQVLFQLNRTIPGHDLCPGWHPLAWWNHRFTIWVSPNVRQGGQSCFIKIHYHSSATRPKDRNQILLKATQKEKFSDRILYLWFPMFLLLSISVQRHVLGAASFTKGSFPKASAKKSGATLEGSFRVHHWCMMYIYV